MVVPVRPVTRALAGDSRSILSGLNPGRYLNNLSANAGAATAAKTFGTPKVKAAIASSAGVVDKVKGGAMTKAGGLLSKAEGLSMAPIAGVVGQIAGGISRMAILDSISSHSEGAVAAAAVDDAPPVSLISNQANLDPVEKSVPTIEEDNDAVEIEEIPPYDLIVGSNLSSTMVKSYHWDMMEILQRWRHLKNFVITGGTNLGTFWTFDQADFGTLLPSYIKSLLLQFNYFDFVIEFDFRVHSTQFDSGLIRIIYCDIDTNFDHSVYKPANFDFNKGLYLPLGSNYSRIIRMPYSGMTPDAVMFSRPITDYCVRNYHNRLVAQHYVPPRIAAGTTVQIFSRIVKIEPKAPRTTEWVETSGVLSTPDLVQLPSNCEEDMTMILFKPQASVVSFNSTSDLIFSESCNINSLSGVPSDFTPCPVNVMRCFCKYVSGGVDINMCLIAPVFRSCMLRCVYVDNSVGDNVVKYTILGDCATFDLSEDFNVNIACYPRDNRRRRPIDESFGTLHTYADIPYADNTDGAASLIVFTAPTTDTEFFQQGNYMNLEFTAPTSGFNYVDFNYQSEFAQETVQTSLLLPVGTGPALTSTTNNEASSAETTVVAAVDPKILIMQNNFLQHCSIDITDNKIPRGGSFELFFANPMNMFSMTDERSNFARSFISTNERAIVRPTPPSAFGLYWSKWNGDFIATVGIAGSTNMSGTFGVVFVPHSGVPDFKGFRNFPLKEIDVSTQRSATISCPYDCSTPFKLIPPTIGKWDTVMNTADPPVAVPRCSYWGSDYQVNTNRDFDLTCSGVLYLVALTDIYVPGDTKLGVNVHMQLAPNFKMFDMRSCVSYKLTPDAPAFTY